jgi:hypothetical protein
MGLFDGWLKPVGDVVVKVLDLIPDANKRAEIEKELTLAGLNAQAALDSELTKRQQADMMSDSWLSKNIRPLALIILSLCFFIMNILSYFNVNPSDKILSIIENLLLMVFGFYFGGRTLEKAASMISTAIKK